MLDLRFIRENKEKVQKNAEAKNASVNTDTIIQLDQSRRETITEVEQLKAKRNESSKAIGLAKRNGEDASEAMAATRKIGEDIKDLDEKLKEIENELNSHLAGIPNMIDESVPEGKSESDNVAIREFGEPGTSKSRLNHIDIGKKLGILDFDRSAKVTGGGFVYYRGKGAALERALISWFLSEHIKNGYEEIWSPFLVNEDSMRGTGQLPKMEEDMYHTEADHLYLIPTAEVPLTNFYRDEMLSPKELTISFCGYSPCFRREAGSHGKEVHGLLRVHQFNKVELLKFTKPEDSPKELEMLTADAENLVKKLGLPYRIIKLCSGDTSFASSMTYDIEVWTPGETKWLEVSSCSNFKDFQARRANIRFKRSADEKPEFVHTLNGSGLATPRIMVAILETFFDGTKFHVPEVLQQFTGFDTIEIP
ncbi:MAG: serine--tRNA ligase [Candidatus Kapaibacteriales bacterium]